MQNKKDITATANSTHEIALNDNYFAIIVNCKSFVGSPINANFKLEYRVNGVSTDWVDMLDASVNFTVANEKIVFRNEKPLAASFVRLVYTKNAVTAGTFDIAVSNSMVIL
jgi:hypothetical protein